ncbi:MAG: outer membrane protein transport protein, partial [Deltaproteobacteria bacterium]
LLEIAVAWKSFPSGDGYMPGAFAVEAGLLRSGWSAYDEVVISYDDGRSDTVIEQNWEDVVDYKIGGFYTFTDYLKIRGGYYKTASPIPEETLGPTTPDGAGRNSFYLGAGYKRRAFLMDLAYVMSDFLPSETRTNPDLTGKYKGNANVLQLSAGYSF